MREITITAGQLASVSEAFKKLEGPRSIQLSFTIGKILQEADEAHKLMVEKIQPLLDSQGNVSEDDSKALEILNESVTLNVPELTIEQLETADLTVTDDFALFFLTSTGIVASE